MLNTRPVSAPFVSRTHNYIHVITTFYETNLL
jgi:hypothetical protein